jgi:hypothetical protein
VGEGQSRYVRLYPPQVPPHGEGLLECPVEDNAIYILDSGEDRLVGMNKQQLRGSGEAKWIYHTGNWYQRLKDELGIE